MIGTILRNVRKIKKLKQKHIANYLNVAENTVSNYETEYSNITFEAAINFIRECDFDILFVDKANNKIYTIEELSKEMDF